MVTAEEQRAVQEENFKDDERFWDTMRDLNAASVEEHKSLIAAAEAKLKGSERAAADASEKRETAKNRLQRLQRGESVSGGLGKKFDIVAAMKAADIKPARCAAAGTGVEAVITLNGLSTRPAIGTAGTPTDPAGGAQGRRLGVLHERRPSGSREAQGSKA